MSSARRLAALALSLAPLLAGALEAPSSELKPFTASFGITWHGMSAGTAQLQLQRLEDGRWSYQSVSTARGLFRLAMPAELRSRSVFAIREGRILPDRFTADDGASSTSKDQDLRFDWTTQRVTGVAEKRRVDLPLKPGVLDTMSVQIALMHELLAGNTPRYFVIVDKGRIKDYNYTAVGEEKLVTPIGEYRTLVFRSTRPGSDTGTYFWCAPELGYLPLKVERREGSKVQWSMALQTASTH
ncbi:MAG: DUF3108 domain-containing protein [Proteobacteria bacterium]|jgi:hypothetical protein|nr:DUF3108 domain-containing protein [Pseudomonadota bacterium]